MYAITCEATIKGDLAAIWGTWTDMVHFRDWDPREEITRLDGPFAAGVTGFSKQVGPRPGSTFRVTLVEPMSRWVNEAPLPGGKLVLDHHLKELPGRRVHLTKRYEAYGPMSLAFRLIFAKGIRAEMPRTFAALEKEAARRAAAGPGYPS